jgi:hypothetical protein
MVVLSTDPAILEFPSGAFQRIPALCLVGSGFMHFPAFAKPARTHPSRRVIRITPTRRPFLNNSD